jgi:hypothetical protein
VRAHSPALLPVNPLAAAVFNSGRGRVFDRSDNCGEDGAAGTARDDLRNDARGGQIVGFCGGDDGRQQQRYNLTYDSTRRYRC